MPKPLIFVACEKVIFDREDNTASLVTIVEGIDISVGANLPETAELPIAWSVFSVWRKEDGDEDKQFRQRVGVVSPSGRIAKQQDTPFRFLENKNNHRVKVLMIGMPIGEAGIWLINLSIKEDTDESQWEVITSLPFEVDHSKEEVTHVSALEK